jgi:predicted RNase H-like HicB family nuclease
MRPIDILKRPYARVLIPETDGQYTAEIMEFPGCVAFGSDAAEALKNLEEVAQDWISAAIEQGQNIPAPLESAEFSGKLVLRMPTGLHRRAAICAQREGASLNQFIVTCLAEAIGEKSRTQTAAISYFHATANANLYFQGNSVGGVAPRISQIATAGYGAQITGPAELVMTATQNLTFPMLVRTEREKAHAGG